MKTSKFSLGLLSSLLLSAGFTAAAELTDPLRAKLGKSTEILNGSTEPTWNCIPCAIIEC